MNTRDIMIRQAHTIPPQCTIWEALRQMSVLHLQAFPVVDEKKRLLGTLSFWQVLEWAMPSYISQDDLSDVRFVPDLAQLHERLGELKPNPVTHVMNPHPPCVRPGRLRIGLRGLNHENSENRLFTAGGGKRPSTGGNYFCLGRR